MRATPLDGTKNADAEKLEWHVAYVLADGRDYLTVLSSVKNLSEDDLEMELVDAVRADGEFKFGHRPESNLWWCQDDYWRQAYGVVAEGLTVAEENPESRRPVRLRYGSEGGRVHTVKPGETFVLERRIYAAPDTLALRSMVSKDRGEEGNAVELTIHDAGGPVEGAVVRVYEGEHYIGLGHSGREGMLHAQLPSGEFRFSVVAQGRAERNFEAKVGSAAVELDCELPTAGYVDARITDDAGKGLPCKLAFHGQDVEDPRFGPDSAVHGIRNLWYTHDGTAYVPLQPGRYEVIVSRGPEYDAVIETIEVAPGKTTAMQARLERTVDTTGWLSAELHSHSSPSGDNTASQRGRVLNLLAEHLEFIPCTEHQRVSTYEPDLAHFGAKELVLTCTGMELTGNPLPINHQNAFPLLMHERTQDGGGPTTDVNPEIQIARLAMWDDESDKVVQINHPNIAQMIGDRDLDGIPDEGFRKMFHFADVMEVHPLQTIFDELSPDDQGPKGRGNTVVNWMQLLNLGYRIPGVINTDAHWNFHGSGWHRNYVKSRTDVPAEAELMEVCHAIEKGHVVMTNGPFMTVVGVADQVEAGPSENLTASSGEVSLRVHVECPNWLDINRVQVFVNGRASESHNYTRRTRPAMFGAGHQKFSREIALSLPSDAHVIVAAAGEGLELGRVCGPVQGKAMPIAVSNPIFIDVDGGGFTPNGDPLGLPLPVEAAHRPTHGHDHDHPHSHGDE